MRPMLRAICEAVARPNMRSVPPKNIKQQAVLSLYQSRQSSVRDRAAQANQIRGLLAELGLTIPQGITHIAQRVPELMEDATNKMTGLIGLLVQRLPEHLKELDRRDDEIEGPDRGLASQHSAESKARCDSGHRLDHSQCLGGSGGRREELRQRVTVCGLAGAGAALELQRRQELLGISKRGGTYLRTLLIHGARSVLYAAQCKTAQVGGWFGKLIEPRNANIAAVALADKNALVVLALLAHDREFLSDCAAANATA
jgi:transposase